LKGVSSNASKNIIVKELGFLQPLLYAYDSKIKALEETLQRNLVDLEDLKVKGQTIVNENNFLRTELGNLTK